MGRRNSAAADDEDSITPEDVLQQYYGPEREAGPLFAQLFTPKSRALILDVLVSERGDALTVSEIVDYSTGGLGKSSVHNHIDDLITLGVVEDAGKKGNAQTYQLNTSHPVAQLLAMLDNVLMWGRTPTLLDEAFIFEGDSHEMLEELGKDDVFPDADE